MNRPDFIELASGDKIPILYEDRSVIAIDKPRGWMLVPFSWQRTARNLQAAIASSIAAGSWWARARGLKFLRYIHRLDSDTSGILLFARSQGAVDTYTRLFESRQMDKTYLVVAHGNPRKAGWTCDLKLAPDPKQIGRMKVDARRGKDAETHFRVLQTRDDKVAGPLTLIEAKPVTGRTHQIRVHLAESGHGVIGDTLYGPGKSLRLKFPLGLRAVSLQYRDPFQGRVVAITAPSEHFLQEFGFGSGG